MNLAPTICLIHVCQLAQSFGSVQNLKKPEKFCVSNGIGIVTLLIIG
jgi:hypothetical protein